MTVLSTLRDRFSRSTTSAPNGSRSADEAQSSSSADAQLPFAGYDRLDMRQVKAALSRHSQVELEAAVSYERSHKDREPVLTKLRYMRGQEPLPGYDSLGVEEIVAALEDADLPTAKRVRAYERKFGNRPEVRKAVARINHRHRASRPKEAGPGYQPLGGALDSSTPADRPLK